MRKYINERILGHVTAVPLGLDFADLDNGLYFHVTTKSVFAITGRKVEKIWCNQTRLPAYRATYNYLCESDNLKRISLDRDYENSVFIGDYTGTKEVLKVMAAIATYKALLNHCNDVVINEIVDGPNA